jgi:hypothetical protein
LVLDFDDTVHVTKYDDWPGYRNGIGKLSGTKAVDLLVRGNELVCLGEVKNFCGHRIENRQKITSGQLFQQAAYKVRDTLAGLLAMTRSGGDVASEAYLAVSHIAESPEYTRMVVFLFVDEDRHADNDYRANRARSRLDVYTKYLKRELSWLKCRIIAFDRFTIPPGIGIVDVNDA